jgi:hypothetical protein
VIPVIVNCAIDGVPFEARRPQAKYCSAKCRKRAQRGSFGQAQSVPRSKNGRSGTNSNDPVVTSIDPASTSSVLGEPTFVKSVREELETAGVLNTVIGQQVVRIAEQMCGRETAGGMTSLSKEFSRIRAEALRSAIPLKADPVDELQARRQAKMAAV